MKTIKLGIKWRMLLDRSRVSTQRNVMRTSESSSAWMRRVSCVLKKSLMSRMIVILSLMKSFRFNQVKTRFSRRIGSLLDTQSNKMNKKNKKNRSNLFRMDHQHLRYTPRIFRISNRESEEKHREMISNNNNKKYNNIRKSVNKWNRVSIKSLRKLQKKHAIFSDLSRKRRTENNIKQIILFDYSLCLLVLST